MTHCRRIGVADNGRPYCVHGPMQKNGSRWRCATKRAEREYGSELRSAQQRRWYDRHALQQNMKRQLRHHRQRLAQLQHQTEGVV